jgi:hypothetical protein
MNLLIQAEIPALTFQSLSIAKTTQQQKNAQSIEFDKQNFRITTPYWIISLEKNGGISSITSRSSGRQLLENRRSGYFAGVINGESVESSGKWDIDSAILSNNQLLLFETGNIGQIPYRLEMKLNSISPRIDFTARFMFNEEKIGRLSDDKREITSAFLHEEKLRYKIFPALGIGTTGVRDLPFTVDETEDKYVEGNYWTALADGHSGIAFFNMGNMGSVHEPDGGFSIPLAYSMYYVWETVILKGSFMYEFSLYPFEGKWNEADLHRRALEYVFACITNVSEKGTGKSGTRVQLFNISSPDVILSALYTVKRIPLIRFYESRGEGGELNLHYLQGPDNFTEVYLLGNEKGKSNSPVTFNPWQIKTLMLRNINSRE